MTVTLAKGQHTPLKVTEKARHRIMVGLGWDPAYVAKLLDKVSEAMGGRKTHHDLDLSCYIYDANTNFIGTVSPDPANTVDTSGKIYHSGDNQEGVGEGDDEELSVELKDLDPAIHHILFVVKIQTGHDFSEIDSPLLRLADGYSNINFLNSFIDGSAQEGADIYVFAHIYRKGTHWQLHFVDEYLKSGAHNDWRQQLPHFLSVK